MLRFDNRTSDRRIVYRASGLRRKSCVLHWHRRLSALQQTIVRRIGRLVVAGIIASSSFTLANFAAPELTKATCFTSSTAVDGLFAYASYNSCDGQVRLVLPDCQRFQSVQKALPCDSSGVFNIGFGQRAQSDASKGPIFSGQREREQVKPTYLWGTRSRTIPVVAYFRYQACSKPPLLRSKCSKWSDAITIELGNNELTAR
jgi:hypothetical protein